MSAIESSSELPKPQWPRAAWQAAAMMAVLHGSSINRSVPGPEFERVLELPLRRVPRPAPTLPSAPAAAEWLLLALLAEPAAAEWLLLPIPPPRSCPAPARRSFPSAHASRRARGRDLSPRLR
eukprot:150050-Prymnesium_polylepis.1